MAPNQRPCGENLFFGFFPTIFGPTFWVTLFIKSPGLHGVPLSETIWRTPGWEIPHGYKAGNLSLSPDFRLGVSLVSQRQVHFRGKWRGFSKKNIWRLYNGGPNILKSRWLG